jgi:hypothetical protein
MAKNKRKATATVACRQDNLYAPVTIPDDHDHDGDGLVVLALKVVPDTKPDVPCKPRLDLPPMFSAQTSDVS